MFPPVLRKSILLLPASLILACSQIFLPPKQELPNQVSIPDCQGNRTREGGLVSRPVYRTWVRYPHLESKKAFEIVLGALRFQGNDILSTDLESGTIRTRIIPAGDQEAARPATIRIVEEESSILLLISLHTTWGTSDSPDLCGFYEEFDRRLKQVREEAQTAQAIDSTPISPEAGEEPKPSPLPSPPVLPSPPPPPSVSTFPPTLPSPIPVPPEKTEAAPPSPVRRGRVAWVYVNLREGPGVHSRILGKVYKDKPVEILDRNRDWLRIRLADGKEGWMSQKAVAEISGNGSSPGPASRKEATKTRVPRKRPAPM